MLDILTRSIGVSKKQKGKTLDISNWSIHISKRLKGEYARYLSNVQD